MKTFFPATIIVLFLVPAAAAEWRALPAGQRPADTRLGPLRGEQGDFRFMPATSAADWQQRAEWVRRVMRVSMGLWPMPTRVPNRPVIHGKLDMGDYTVEKVYFESIPGFYLTGNLYRPAVDRGRHPAVLSPHGHFPGGRFQDEGRQEVRRKIVHGAERFEDGGRSFMQSRCVQLARMGCVVFHYDMVGYGDSRQIPLEVAHRFSNLRTQYAGPPEQGLYSADALLKQHNSLGLHTFNSIRALDFLASLPDVDPDRIAVTGGSGGGTQTFMLCALDDRPLVSVPVVIVSTMRQGGCTCENVCGLRIDNIQSRVYGLARSQAAALDLGRRCHAHDEPAWHAEPASTLRAASGQEQPCPCSAIAISAQLQPRQPLGNVSLVKPAPEVGAG